MTRWTDTEKDRAVAAYVESANLGEAQRAVAREDGSVPSKNSIRAWAKKAGHDPDGIGEQAAAKTQAARNVAQRQWQDRRADMVHQLGATAQLALDETARYLYDMAPDKAQKAATTCAILIDKAQVLSGDATAIVRTPWDAEAVRAEAKERADNIRPLRSA